MTRAAAFLDRDGTVIFDPGYLRDPDAVELLPGAIDALKALGSMGYALVLVSNRAGVKRGRMSQAEADAVHAAFVAVLHEHDVHLTGAYYCDHLPADGCSCRKPAPGLLEQAAADLDLDVTQSIMVGNHDSDLEAGRRAGCALVFRVESDDSATGWASVIDALR